MAQIIRGVTYSKGDQVSTRTNKIILTADNITLEGNLEIKKEVFLYNEFQISDDKKLNKNDIFICFSSGSKEHLGKVAFIDNDTNFYAGGFMGIIRAGKENEPKYFYQLLNTLLRQTIRDIGNGANINNLSGIINEVKIPIPPKSIQEKYVQEMEVINRREENIKDAIEKFKAKINNIMDSVDGPLVRLQEITLKIGSGSTPRGGESAYIESGITLIRSQNIYDDEFYENGLVFIDDDQAKSLNNVTVEVNDVLFNITGASVARCCIVDASYLPARVNQHVAIIRTNERALPKYVQQILVSSKYKNELLNLADNSSTREAITKAQLEDFKIPLLPLSEQENIVSQIETIETKITLLEKEIIGIPQEKELVLKKYL